MDLVSIGTVGGILEFKPGEPVVKLDPQQGERDHISPHTRTSVLILIIQPETLGRTITLELLPTGPPEKVSNDVDVGSARDSPLCQKK